MVPYVEVRTELRRRQVDTATDDVIPHGNRQNGRHHASSQQDDRSRARHAAVRCNEPCPRADHHGENKRVLAGEAETPSRQAHRDPRALLRARRACCGGRVLKSGEQIRQQGEHGRHEQHIKNRFLDERVEEDRGRIASHRQASDDARPTPEQTRGGVADENARHRAEDRLNDADDQQIAPEQRIQGAKEIRVQRGLVENVRPDPITRGELPGPGVVPARVAHQDGEEWRAAHLRDVHQPHGQCDGEGRKGVWSQWKLSDRSAVCEGRADTTSRSGPPESRLARGRGRPPRPWTCCCRTGRNEFSSITIPRQQPLLSVCVDERQWSAVPTVVLENSIRRNAAVKQAGSEGYRTVRHPHRRDLIHEVVAEDAVPVTQQIAWCRLPRKGFSELLRGPCSRRVNGQPTWRMRSYPHGHSGLSRASCRHLVGPAHTGGRPDFRRRVFSIVASIVVSQHLVGRRERGMSMLSPLHDRCS